MTCPTCGFNRVSEQMLNCPSCARRSGADSAAAASTWPPAPAFTPIMPAVRLADRARVAKRKMQANLGIGGGVLSYAGFIGLATTRTALGQTVGPCLLVAALILFVWGLCCYAEYKGYSALLGLLGLIGLIGLIVLAVLPHKNKELA